MEKTVAICVSEFEVQARKAVSLAFVLCEYKIKSKKGNVSPELKALSSAALSLDRAIDVFIAAERLCK